MKEKKSCYNCVYLETEYKCTNINYLNARGNCKSTGKAQCYCTWYKRKEKESNS
ncbi:TPA: hypothetical protein PTW06_001927 [Clostridium botulinum]|nr:hypothetical protein [Clostridium botulinum]HDK7223218.1 hypothetical protein [Clostridium botulinum]HDK7272068.1 hypothetical protein [Clostridium botulinum]HDK7305419.1 hypothetical protein [Clostridium botulinum]